MRTLDENSVSLNHASARGRSKVRVAIIGVGNCASSLVQGVEFYKDAPVGQRVPGLMHVELGGYHIRDIEFTAAFDIDKNKVGKDLSEAIFSEPNNTYTFSRVPRCGVSVHRGMTHDGLGKYLGLKIEKAAGSTADIVKILRDTRTDVVVSYLPVGSEMATKWYVEQVLEAGCAFVNCIPVFIASQPYWQKRFSEKGLPLIGDDIKSQDISPQIAAMLRVHFACGLVEESPLRSKVDLLTELDSPGSPATRAASRQPPQTVASGARCLR